MTRIFLSNLERFLATVLGCSFFIYVFIEQRAPSAHASFQRVRSDDPSNQRSPLIHWFLVCRRNLDKPKRDS